MHKTVVVHNRYAWRSNRTKAAFGSEQGLRILTIEQLAARLAGGFLAPVDPDCLKNAVAGAIEAPLGELDSIKQLPGFQRAAAASLVRSWGAGLTLDKEAEYATDRTAKERLSSFSALEQEALSRLPSNQIPPGELVAAALQRVRHAREIFGRIEIHGRTEMSPVWRPLLSAIAEHTDVVWVAEAREIPAWLSSDTNVSVEESQRFEPAIRRVSCANPRHEILEAFRWARQHLATGIPPQELAIATASPEMWDDHVLAQAESSNLPMHFIHGRPALSTAGGQLCAALAEILLRGFSFMRVVRFVALLRNQNKRFEQVPGNWWRALPREAPLLDAPPLAFRNKRVNTRILFGRQRPPADAGRGRRNGEQGARQGGGDWRRATGWTSACGLAKGAHRGPAHSPGCYPERTAGRRRRRGRQRHGLGSGGGYCGCAPPLYLAFGVEFAILAAPRGGGSVASTSYRSCGAPHSPTHARRGPAGLPDTLQHGGARGRVFKGAAG